MKTGHRQKQRGEHLAGQIVVQSFHAIMGGFTSATRLKESGAKSNEDSGSLANREIFHGRMAGKVRVGSRFVLKNLLLPQAFPRS